MNTDKNTLDKLRSLDDKELRALIYEISDALGADRRKAGALADDMGKLRGALESIGPQEAQKLMDMAGKEKAQEIYEILKRRGG